MDKVSNISPEELNVPWVIAGVIIVLAVFIIGGFLCTRDNAK